MLAILIDSPSLAMRLFSAINDARYGHDPPGLGLLLGLMESLVPNEDTAEKAQWNGLISRVQAIEEGSQDRPYYIGPFLSLVSSVARFSFEPERRLRYR
jgi:hypothetical protein